MRALASVSFAFLLIGLSQLHAQTERALSGTALPDYPWFYSIETYNHDQPVVIGLYPFWSEGAFSAQVYVTTDKSTEEWTSDPVLNDVTDDGIELLSFDGGNIATNVFELCAPLELEAYPEDGIGVGYDIVIDVDGSGTLTSPDIIDGLYGTGFFVVGNITQSGPYQVVVQDWTETEELTKRIWYPQNLAELGARPFVVISHGWTHEYTYYDHLGEHLASYGYIVMSHWNDVGNGNAAGTNSASFSLIANVEHLLDGQSELFGGVLDGLIDHHHMCWTGHSTGGETPVRAYTRMRTGQITAGHFNWQDVQLISSICPVAFLNGEQSNPYDVNYHQFLGGADTDASGFAADGYYQPLSIFERCTGNRQLTYIHGAGHEVFHNFYSTETWPDSLASGPDLVGKAQVHPVMKSYLLAMCEWYLKGNRAGKDYLTRNYELFHPMGLDESLVITNEYRDAHYTDKYVLDDFQTNPENTLMSSGAQASYLVIEPEEILMQDFNGSFAYDQNQPSNGMTRARYDDDPRCTVFTWSVGGVLYMEIAEDVDISMYDVLSFRASMPTRHPQNDSLDLLDFSVFYYDQEQNGCYIPVSPFAVIRPPYPRDEGGELHICLPAGEYTVEVAGTSFSSETFFEIPGYVPYSTTGSYTFQIPESEDCLPVDIFMYDTYGDGWDNGDLTIYNAEGDTVAYGTLYYGFGPEPGEGWQNEFVTIRIPLDVMLSCDDQPDLNNPASFGFHFGMNNKTPGAIAIDDIELIRLSPGLIVNSVESVQWQDVVSVYPNPAKESIFIQSTGGEYRKWINISDVSGRTVLRVETDIRQPLDISQLPEGVYNLRIESRGNYSSTRFVKLNH